MEIDHYDIEKYIQGELSGNELVEFEASLEKDEALRKKVHFYQYAMSTLTKNKAYIKAEEDKIAEINPMLEEMRDKYFINKTVTTETPQKEAESKPTLVRRLLPFVALAAAAALLIFLFVPKEPNFKPYPLSSNPMGSDSTAVLFKDAQKNYNNGKYEEAYKLLTAFLDKNPKTPEVWLAKGCAAFELDNINDALNSFEKVTEMDDGGIFHPYAHWYLALCYLKKDDREKAIHHLSKIKEGADNFADAKRLLYQLK